MAAECAGTTEEASKQKKGYKLPRGQMTNADLTRLINSDEIQSIVRQPKTGRTNVPLKKNPLKNLGALLKLNPYAKTARRAELLAQVRTHTGMHVNSFVSFLFVRDQGGLGIFERGREGPCFNASLLVSQDCPHGKRCRVAKALGGYR